MRWVARIMLLVAVAAGIAGCISFSIDKAVIRYRLTVNFEVGGKPVSASSVYEVTYRDAGGSGSGTILAINTSSFQGQALVLTIKDHSTLIVAQHDGGLDGWMNLFIHACGLAERFDNESKSAYLARLRAFDDTCDVPVRHLLLLAIRDHLDPYSLRVVDRNNSTSQLGVQVKMISASVAKTDAAVTEGIRDIFPWVQAPGTIVMPSENIFRKLPLGKGKLITNNMFILGSAK